MMASMREEINKLIQEANTLSEQGQWEAALLVYRKGLQIRPHSMVFRAGAQRATYVIKNFIGALGRAETIKAEAVLPKKTSKIKRTSSSVTANSIKRPFVLDEKPLNFGTIFEKSEFKELEKDLKFIQQATQNNFFPKTSGDETMLEHLNLLLKKNKVWSKQGPSFYQRNENVKFDPNEKFQWTEIITNLEAMNNPAKLLETATKHLDSLQNSGLLEIDKMQIQGEIYYYILKAQIEMGNYDTAETYNEWISSLAEKIDDEELGVRSNYLQGRAYALSGNYVNAAKTWKDILRKTTNPGRIAHLLHEVGRCYFKLNRIQQARAYGMLSLESAKEANNDIWVRNAAILIAQIETERGYKTEALQYYAIAESAARRLNDQRTLFNVICESTKLGKKLRRPKIDECNLTVKQSEPKQQSSYTTLRRPKSVPINYLLQKKAKLDALL